MNNRVFLMHRKRAVAWLVAFVVFLIQVPTQADEAADVERGKQLYLEGKHDEAEGVLRDMLEKDPPMLRDPIYVNRARMIRAACDMHLGKRKEAIKLFELILKSNVKFEPDPILFPPSVYEEFRRARDRIERETSSNKKCDDAEKNALAQKAKADSLAKRVDKLTQFASVEKVITKRSRVLASLPFGIGQFQNGDIGLGIFFASTEALALIASTVSFAIHQSIPSDEAARTSGVRYDAEQRQSVALAARVVNYMSIGTFLTLAIGGIVQANLAYQPDIITERKRTLPTIGMHIKPIVSPLQGGAYIGIGASF